MYLTRPFGVEVKFKRSRTPERVPVARTLRPQGSLCQLLLTFTVKTSSHTWISRLSREANVKFSVGLDDCLLSACDFRSGGIRVDINPDVTSKPFLTCIDSIQRPSLRLNSLHIRIVTT